MNLTIRKFKREDFDDYKAWFADEALAYALEGVDEAWLEHILDQTDGVELVASLNEELVGVIGIVFPTDQNATIGITNFAVKPENRGRGLGSKILAAVFGEFNDVMARNWVCFVEPANTRAQNFFTKNGWKNRGITSTGELLRFTVTFA